MSTRLHDVLCAGKTAARVPTERGATPIVGIQVKSPTRTETYVGLDDPHVQAAASLVEAASKHIKDVMGQYAWESMGMGVKLTFPRASKRARRRFNAKVGPLNYRITIQFNDGPVEPLVDLTAMMDGSRSAWKVLVLMPQQLRMFPPPMV